MRINEVTYGKLKTPLKVKDNLNRGLELFDLPLLRTFKLGRRGGG